MRKSVLNDTQYIIQVREHYEAYHSTGEFICSGDTFKECSEELLKAIRVEANMLQPVVA